VTGVTGATGVGAVGAIVFDVPNVGGTLEVETDGVINFTTTDTGQIQLSAVDNIEMESTAQDINMQAAGGISFTWEAIFAAFGGSSSEIDLFTDATGLEITPAGFEFIMQAAAAFKIFNSLGDQCLRVDEDGTIHLKAGASIVYDLP